MANKIPFDQMIFLFEAAYETFLDTLFKNHAEQHGWTKEEFMENYNQFYADLESGEEQVFH